MSHQKKQNIKDSGEAERLPKEKTSSVSSSSPRSPPRDLQSTVPSKSESRSTANADSDLLKKVSSNGHQLTDKVAVSSTSHQPATSVKSEIPKAGTPKAAEKSHEQVMSRPSSAPLVPGPRPTAPVVSMVHTAPLLARSVSAAGRLGPDLSPATHSYIPQSYRNAKIGNSIGSSSSAVTHSNSPNLGVNQSPAYSQQPALVSSPMFIPQSSERNDPNVVQSGYPFGSKVNCDVMQNGHQWMESSQMDNNRVLHRDPSSLVNDMQNLDLYKSVPSGSREHFPHEFPAGTSGRQSQGMLVDEFPHLDIINDLLDEEHGIGMASRASTVQSVGNGPQMLNRQYSFPCDLNMSSDMMGPSAGSCRFERTLSYHDEGFHRSYSSSGSQYESHREYVPQASPLHYSNGQMDGMVQQPLWQMGSPDMSLFGGVRNPEGDSYPYMRPDSYSNLACGVNGYTVYRPSNGH